MGIDYDSIGGLGIQVEVKVRYEDETTWMSIDGKDVQDMDDFLSVILQGSGYMYGSAGNLCYEVPEYYIFVEEKKAEEYNISAEKEALLKFCADNNIETIGNFDFHHRMRIW